MPTAVASSEIPFSVDNFLITTTSVPGNLRKRSSLALNIDLQFIKRDAAGSPAACPRIAGCDNGLGRNGATLQNFAVGSFTLNTREQEGRSRVKRRDVDN
jgi:hypothetical protein